MASRRTYCGILAPAYPETRDQMRDCAVLPILHPAGERDFELGSREQRSDLHGIRFNVNGFQCLMGLATQ